MTLRPDNLDDIEKGFGHGIRLPRFSSTFLCNWGIYMKIRLFPTSLAVYVLPEVTILPLGMTITSIITN